jgi:DNA-binding response OmpR family regulator
VRRILITDDELMIWEILEATAEDAGFEPLLARRCDLA